jgi:hypothetical protein
MRGLRHNALPGRVTIGLVLLIVASAQAAKPSKTNSWSLQPVVRPVLPKSPAHPIDVLIQRRLKTTSLTLSPPADRVTYARRIYLDMHGLPPTPGQIDAFVQDKSPKAYSKLIEHVLQSPRHGERWARHWLDVVRFAESNGFETNFERANAWPYRDYVIDSFNNDKPYDRFVFEQIAGDTVGADAATGFLVGGPWDKVKSPDKTLTLMQRENELADITNTVSTTFLGLTLGCARCHDHKFDPIPQSDYYAMKAVFAGVQHGERQLVSPGDKERDLKAKQLSLRIKTLEAELGPLQTKTNARQNTESFTPTQARFVRFTVMATNSAAPCIDELEIWSTAVEGKASRNVGLASAGGKATSSGNYPNNPKHQLKHINDGQYGNGRSWISNQPGKGWVQIELPEPAMIDRIDWGRDRQKKYTDRLATQYVIEVAMKQGEWKAVAGTTLNKKADPKAAEQAARRKQLTEEIKQLKTKYDAIRKKDHKVYAGNFRQPPKTHLLYRGDPLAPRNVVAPGGLSVLKNLGMAVDEPESKRRITLARWIASKNNPLTARVMVNRIWQSHFGVGLVPTPSDFGGNGVGPTHPQLLDWLAAEFMAKDWSVKHIQRLILTSRTYRQASKPRPAGIAKDAASKWLWRFPPRRLEAEAIHDSILSVSGVLDLKMGGPGFNVFEPNKNYVRVYKPLKTYGPAHWRRMIYMRKIRMEQDAVFGVFDCPDAGQPTSLRSRSTTPLQALNLFTSLFILQQADLFAKRLEKEVKGNPAAQVNHAFSLTFGRSPEPVEREEAIKLIEAHGLSAFCRVLFNTNEFMFLP